MTDFKKLDAGKPMFQLIPPDALTEIALVLTMGADKYEPGNWLRGAAWSRYFGAMLRHLFAFWRGEERDPESGLLHLAHAGACLLFLLSYQLQGLGTDDRRALVGGNHGTENQDGA